MRLNCKVRLVAPYTPKYSFKCFMLSTIFLGMKKSPKLILVTKRRVMEFELVENVKKVYQSQIENGKISLEFERPPRLVLISSTSLTASEDLAHFIALPKKLSNRNTVEKMNDIPVIPSEYELILQSAKPPKNSTNLTILNVYSSLLKSFIKNPSRKIAENLKIVDLPDCNISKLPVNLGQIGILKINLEDNLITDADLSWLNEMPIRKSLTDLNLGGNQITTFPSVLIDYPSLYSLNLRNNYIKYIPGGIGELCNLRHFDISGNHLPFLPASISSLRLHELKLASNYLMDDPVQHIPNHSPENIIPHLRLQDLAARIINRSERCTLSFKDCPSRLLDRLRCSSRCICGAKSTPWLHKDEEESQLSTIE